MSMVSIFTTRFARMAVEIIAQKEAEENLRLLDEIAEEAI
jgi:hypothetical protein